MVTSNNNINVGGFFADGLRIHGVVISVDKTGIQIRISEQAMARWWAPSSLDMGDDAYTTVCGDIQGYLQKHAVTLVGVRDWDVIPAANASQDTEFSRELIRHASEGVCQVVMVRPKECRHALDGLAFDQTTVKGHWPRAVAVAVQAFKIHYAEHNVAQMQMWAERLAKIQDQLQVLVDAMRHGTPTVKKALALSA
jgi:hypothetical protein